MFALAKEKTPIKHGTKDTVPYFLMYIGTTPCLVDLPLVKYVQEVVDILMLRSGSGVDVDLILFNGQHLALSDPGRKFFEDASSNVSRKRLAVIFEQDGSVFAIALAEPPSVVNILESDFLKMPQVPGVFGKNVIRKAYIVPTSSQEGVIAFLINPYALYLA